jgi:hypothetical protein
MTARLTATALAAAAALLALPGVAAHAESGHQITFTCETSVSPLLHPSPVLATAVAGGHVRPVATSVTCVVTADNDPPVTFHQENPGSAAATGGVLDSVFPAYSVCVSAEAYWSDGDHLGGGPYCGYANTGIYVVTDSGP